MAGFVYKKSRAGTTDAGRKKIQIAASATVTKGDALEFASTQKLQRINAQADTVKYVANEDETATATSLSEIDVIDVFGAIFEIEVTPTVNDTLASSGSTTTAVVALAAASDNDMVGGTIYFPDQDATRIISANAYSGGNCTFTWLEALTRAVASGDKVRAIPFGVGSKPKFDGTDFHKKLSNVQADRSGGTFEIYQVDMKNKAVQGFFT